MTDKEFLHLLDRYLDGTCTPDERRLVEDYYQRHVEQGEGLSAWNESQKAHAREQMKAQIWKQVRQKEAVLLFHPAARWMRVAAVIVVLCAFAVSLYLVFGDVMNSWNYEEVTSPGRTITRIDLSDGTRVELSPSSTLRYPDTFGAGEREVYLDGEAFFMVATDRERPFHVKTGTVTTTVLGTAFNVRYIPALEELDVAVIEGRVAVAVRSLFNPKSVELRPGERGQYAFGGGGLTKNTDIGARLAWRREKLVFEDLQVEGVFDRISRWYGVSVTITEPFEGACRIRGSFDNVELTELLTSLAFVVEFDYELSGERLLVQGGSCD